MEEAGHLVEERETMLQVGYNSASSDSFYADLLLRGKEDEDGKGGVYREQVSLVSHFDSTNCINQYLQTYIMQKLLRYIIYIIIRVVRVCVCVSVRHASGHAQ